MMNQGNFEIGCFKLLPCRIKTSATNEELLMIMIVNTEERTVQGQNGKTESVDRYEFYRTACCVCRERADGFEIVVIP